MHIKLQQSDHVNMLKYVQTAQFQFVYKLHVQIFELMYNRILILVLGGELYFVKIKTHIGIGIFSLIEKSRI